MFRWMRDVVVVPHHQPNRVRIDSAQRHFPGRPILAIAHDGAVIVQSGQVCLLTPGEGDVATLPLSGEGTHQVTGEPLSLP